jgi:hypothetical protein
MWVRRRPLRWCPYASGCRRSGCSAWLSSCPDTCQPAYGASTQCTKSPPSSLHTHGIVLKQQDRSVSEVKERMNKPILTPHDVEGNVSVIRIVCMCVCVGGERGGGGGGGGG